MLVVFTSNADCSQLTTEIENSAKQSEAHKAIAMLVCAGDTKLTMTMMMMMKNSKHTRKKNHTTARKT